MNKVFQFKQFSVDQTDCGMKVNTDAALLGSLAAAGSPGKILEIGTGTGVIALMLAQRYTSALVDAVEIDPKTAVTASLNFRNSPFSDRLTLITSSFQDYFNEPNTPRYDLIVSNPPYFINSLKSNDPVRELARHTNEDFFSDIVEGAASHLTDHGLFCLILPLDTTKAVEDLTAGHPVLGVAKKILIHSFPKSEPYRCILVLGKTSETPVLEKFVIYERQGIYTNEYRQLLKDFLIIF